MIIDILTIFPEMFTNVLQESILKRAQEKNLVTINVHNLRDWTTDKHKITDDKPFGGGPGMVMKPEPIFRAVDSLLPPLEKGGQGGDRDSAKVILLTPKGNTFSQPLAQQLSTEQHLIFICGRYEGVDYRVHQYLADMKISIGNYVLTGGELPAMVITDAVTRLIPGVLGNPESLEHESFSAQQINTTNEQMNNKLNIENSKIRKFENSILDFPQYTQPRSFEYQGQQLSVPEILLTGNHQKIEEWRKKKSRR